ncbi:Transposase IS4 [Popillia japonica]|uniref:Transposase IS4 n=1 Tax=Popillia japonica TaxID=7064 RepID=A0AAW1IXD5_POPJA
MIANENATKGEEWFPVTSDELQAYFALCIIMSQVKKSSIDMGLVKPSCCSNTNILKTYAPNRAVVATPIFSKPMPRKRFLAISHFLHFTGNKTMNKDDKLNKIRNVIDYFTGNKTMNKDDKLNKIRNVIDYLNEKFLQLYTPNESVAIYESLMKFRGRLSDVQFIASKRVRFGIKFYKLCESKSGYCSQFRIYVGSEIVNNKKTPVSQHVMMKLAESILGKGYTLYLDNWYSSPHCLIF